MRQGQDGPVLAALNAGFRLASKSLQGFGALNPAVLGFIVLSGYCIHRNGLRRARFTVKPYAYKRFFRIIPVFVLAACVGFALLVMLGGNELVFILTGRQQPDPAAFLFRLSGLTAFVPSLYPAVFQGNAPLNTVMVEIWLYAAYPLLLLVLRRFGPMAFAGLILTAFIGGWIAGQVLGEPIWFQTSTIYKFLPYWWIGAVFVTFEHNIVFTRTILACLGIYAAAYFFGLRHAVFVEVLHVGIALAFAALIRASEDRGVARRIVTWFGWLGRSSYSLYAFHAPLVILCLHFGFAWWATLLAVLAAVQVPYLLVERPATALGRRLAARTGPAFS